MIATFDADHVPRADYLERTLGFFADPAVAIVQVPQRYHNLDSLQHRVSWRSRRMYGEQDVFFNLVMPGKDHWNASFFCGTGAVLRRSALRPHGGLLTGTITEDMHTALALQAEGWKSIYLNEMLVTGLAPMDFSSYSSQRLRWAEGNLKIVRLLNPLTCAGLSVAQRICYFASMYHWTIGFAKVVFYAAPPLILFTGQFPIANFDRTFVMVYAAHLVSLVGSYKLLSRGTGRIVMDEIFNMANFYTLLSAAKRFVFGRRAGTFVVTSKRGGESGQERAVLPQYVLIAMTVTSLVWSTLGLGFGVTEDIVGAGIATFWALYNLALMLVVVGFASRPAQKRQSVRFRSSVPIELLDVPTNGRLAVSLDLSEGGCTLLWPGPLAVGKKPEAAPAPGPARHRVRRPRDVDAWPRAKWLDWLWPEVRGALAGDHRPPGRRALQHDGPRDLRAPLAAVVAHPSGQGPRGPRQRQPARACLPPGRLPAGADSAPGGRVPRDDARPQRQRPQCDRAVAGEAGQRDSRDPSGAGRRVEQPRHRRPRQSGAQPRLRLSHLACRIAYRWTYQRGGPAAPAGTGGGVMSRRIVTMLVLLVFGEIGVFYVENRDVVAMNESADALVLDARFPDVAQSVLARERVSRRVLERVADVAQRRHDVALQVVALERIVSSAPGDTEARLRLAQALREAGRFVEAERIYRQELQGLDYEGDER